MSLAQDIDLLAAVSLFEAFPEEPLRLLAFGSKRKYFRDGEVIFREGESSDGGFVIAEGQVDMLIVRNGREIILSGQLRNSLVGEVALITRNKRTASAVARGKTEVLHIPRDTFMRMLEEYPELAQRLHNRISQTVQEMISNMSRVQERLAGMGNLSSRRDNAEDVVAD